MSKFFSSYDSDLMRIAARAECRRSLVLRNCGAPQRLDADDLASVAALLDSHETAASAKRLIDEGKK